MGTHFAGTLRKNTEDPGYAYNWISSGEHNSFGCCFGIWDGEQNPVAGFVTAEYQVRPRQEWWLRSSSTNKQTFKGY